MSISTQFSAAGASAELVLKPGQSAAYSAAGADDWVGKVELQRARADRQAWEVIDSIEGDLDGTDSMSGTLRNETNGDQVFRFVATEVVVGEDPADFAETVDASITDENDTLREIKLTDGTVIARITDNGIEFVVPITPSGGVVRTSRKLIIPAGVLSKAATASGWTTAAVNSMNLATLAASLSGKALVVPVVGLKVGDTITGFHLIGQIESAGNAVTIDADLRKHTAAAADIADASVGAITQLSVVADTIMSASNTRKADLAEVVAADETFYVVITGTTLGSTDVALQGVAIEITEG